MSTAAAARIRRPCTFGDLRATINCQPAELLYVINAFRKAGCSFLMPEETEEIKDTTPIDVSHEALIRQWSKMKTAEGGKGWLEKEKQDAETWRSLAGETVSFQEDRRYRLSSKQTLRFQTWWKQREPSLAWVCRYWRDATSTFSDALRTDPTKRQKTLAIRPWILAAGVCIATLLLTTVIYQLDSRAQGRYASELEDQNDLLAQKTTELEQQKRELELQKAELVKQTGNWPPRTRPMRC